MISSELLANKIQEIMGAQYKCVPFHLYLQDYTQPYKTPDGIEYTTDAQAFEIDKGIIPCVIKCTESTPNSAPYTTKTLFYEATFSVPLNVSQTDNTGALLKTPEFDFFADYKRLYEAVRFKELAFNENKVFTDSYEIDPDNINLRVPYDTSVWEFWQIVESQAPIENHSCTLFEYSDIENMPNTYNISQSDGETRLTVFIPIADLDIYGIKSPNEQLKDYIQDKGKIELNWSGERPYPKYKGRLTMTEPVFAGKEIDKQERVLWRITGNFEVYAENVRTGGDIKICVVLDGDEFEFENMSNLMINADRQAVANQSSNDLSNKLTTATKTSVITFTVEDVDETMHSDYLRNIVDLNPDIINPFTEIKHRQKNALIRLYRKEVLRKEFWAVVGVSYAAASVANVGVFSVSLTAEDAGDTGENNGSQ